MALITCKECKKEISDQADACPHCGAKRSKPSGCLIITAIVIGIVMFFGLFSGYKTKAPASVSSPATGSSAPAPEPPPPPLTKSQLKAEADVAKIKDDGFCLTFGRVMRATKNKPTDYSAAMIERATRVGVTLPMLDSIRARQPMVGMNACAVMAALGRADRVNHSVIRGSEHHQLVYSDRGMYVYLDDFVVTSWQD